MRLLMLNNEFPPLGGGTGTVNHALLKRFAAVPGLEIELITAALGHEPEQEQFSKQVRIFKVPVDNRDIHHSSNRELGLYSVRALRLALAQHRTRPYDFCFAWSALPAGAVALTLRRVAGVRYLVRVCGPDIPGFERRYRWLYPILSPLIRAVWRGAETVVAKCEGEAQMIRVVDPHPHITLVPNGVEPDDFAPGEKAKPGEAFRILCVARLIERKGQRHLIEAVKRLADQGIAVTVELVGSGDARAVYEA